MPMGRPKTPLLLNPEENAQLRAVAASRSLPHGLVLRAKIILLSALGMSNQAIGRVAEALSDFELGVPQSSGFEGWGF